MADNVTDQGTDNPIEPTSGGSSAASAGASTSDMPEGGHDAAKHGAPVSPPRSTRAGSHASEWTVSDARGPLIEADGFSPIESDVPGDAGASDLDEARGSATGGVGGTATADPGPSSSPAKISAWPIAAGLIVGAVIGAGSALVYVSTTTGGSDIDKQVASLSARVDGLQARPDLQPAVDGLKASLAKLDARVGTMQQVGGTTAKTGGTDAGPAAAAQTAAARDTPTFDPAPLTRQIATLQAGIEALRKHDEDAESKVAALQKQAADAQQGVAILDAGQKALASKLTNSPALAVVADSLVARIALGGPYTAQVEALASIGADPVRIAVLKENADKGVPTARALAASFEPLADPIVATEHHAAAADASFVDKMKSGLSGLVSIRSVGDTTGDGLASKVATIESDLAHDDVPAAFAVWNALPAAAKAKSEAWGVQAKTNAEAMTAARVLQSEAIAALGAKKADPVEKKS